MNTDLYKKIYRRVSSLFQPKQRGFLAVSPLLAQGPDVARYEIYFDPDLASEHISFAFQKLTEGTTYKDPTIETMWQGIKKLPVRGGYHYMRSGMSWQAQVDNYLNVAASYDHNVHACDLEGINNTYSQTFFADTRRWIDAIRTATHQKVVLYTNLSTLKEFTAAILKIYPDGQEWLDKLDLWIAWPSETAAEPPVDKWVFWQQSWVKPPDEAGTGAYSDWNYFNGTEAQLLAWVGGEVQPSDVITTPYDGVVRVRGERFGRQIYVNTFTASKVRVVVKNEYSRPSDLCVKYGAQFAFNGDDWDRATYQVINNNSPSLIIYPDGRLWIGNHYTEGNNSPHSSGVRYLVQDGVNQCVHQDDSTLPKWTEKHARSLRGLTADGRFVNITVDGDYPGKGVTLWELAEIALEFECVTAFDGGGGGDSVDVMDGGVQSQPDDDTGGVRYERKVPQTILVFAENGGSIMNGKALEILGKSPTVRSTPAVESGNSVRTLAPGVEIEFTEVVNGKLVSTDKWFKLPDGNYVNYIISGRAYFLITQQPEEPPVEPDPVGDVDVHVTISGDVVTVTVNGQEYQKA